MDFYTATEESYKNGYAKGYEDGKRDALKHGKWMDNYMKNIVAYISLLMFAVCCILGMLEEDLMLLGVSGIYAITVQLWKEDKDIWDDY